MPVLTARHEFPATQLHAAGDQKNEFLRYVDQTLARLLADEMVKAGLVEFSTHGQFEDFIERRASVFVDKPPAKTAHPPRLQEWFPSPLPEVRRLREALNYTLDLKAKLVEGASGAFVVDILITKLKQLLNEQ